MTSQMAYLHEKASDRNAAIEKSSRELANAADILLDDLCLRFGRARKELDGKPLALDAAIKRMREVLL